MVCYDGRAQAQESGKELTVEGGLMNFPIGLSMSPTLPYSMYIQLRTDPQFMSTSVNLLWTVTEIDSVQDP